MIKELGVIKFIGLPESTKEQPEVIDPKTKKPYNLNDPDLPVVKGGHKFTYYYWKMPKTKPAMLRYLAEHWEYFNKTRFDGRLLKPKLAIMKDVNARSMHKRGYCRYGTPCLISISPNLFNAPHEGWVNNTLIHEMAHQDVYEQWRASGEPFSTLPTGKSAHGYKWMSAMIKAGLRPLAKDYTQNDTYMDKDELNERTTHRQAIEEDVYRATGVTTNAIAAIYDADKKLIPVVVAGRSTKDKKMWVILTKPSIFSFRLVPDMLLFTTKDRTELEKTLIKDNAKYQAVVEKLIEQKIATRVV